MSESKKLFEPGTLEKTRQNIGQINKAEAEHMMKVLGGEIIQEKSVAIDTKNLPNRSAKTIVRSTTNINSAKTSAEAALLSSTKTNLSSSENDFSSKSSISKTNSLPNISMQDWILVDKLMMSPEYHIKTDYGIFNFVRFLQKNGLYRIDKNFASYTMRSNIEHLQSFVTLAKTIVTLSPSAYKTRLKREDDLKFRFLRKISSWNILIIQTLYNDIQDSDNFLQIQDFFPLIKEIYSLLVQILFLGERKVTSLLKEIYEDLLLYSDIKRSAVASTIKDCSHEWVYIFSQIVKGLYPLLYCCLGGPFQDCSSFFSKRASDILKITGKSRFDVLLPGSDVPVKPSVSVVEEKPQEETSPKKSKIAEEELRQQKAKKELVSAGIKILDTLFPEAGFKKLDTFPDFYPYFQPLFDFPDGFNLLSPENPMHFIVLMLRIIEDLFQGCRNINFVFQNIEVYDDKKTDSISEVLNEWASYREVLFDKTYCQYLKSFVSEQYTKRDFSYTQYGKSIQNTLFWLIKYHFLPKYSFDKLVLERPEHNNSLKNLSSRLSFVCSFFTEISHNIDVATKNKSTAVSAIQNPWEHYKFDLSNTVSERLDVLLMAKRTTGNVIATNANLIKYTLCICSVLDWWINSDDSPAYSTDPFKFYRISLTDGGPLFSVPVRSDQKKLFTDNVKKMMAAQQLKRMTATENKK